MKCIMKHYYNEQRSKIKILKILKILKKNGLIC